ncbi:class I SAM-dependent methyltransferase [Georgenia subflava]|uniref:Methyltransferase domain-containing protein n=1 Tax=Georgenia subflava TaxID=1622177 RepID=A0A6N7EEQ7_9MICO|nr:class I SAM-dependent methyltransferase [Georgenia subflava]MPV36589.1 methyltransferase domain-containing protein [Georgenia subflava]
MPDVVACRSCESTELKPFLSLGHTPLPDALVSADRLGQACEVFPLDVVFCAGCTLVQILEDVPPEQLFVDNYLYFSSFSDQLLRHAKEHAETLIASRELDSSSLVVELASNDGYLLKNFVSHGIRAVGVDPAPDQAQAAREVGVTTVEEFFGVDLARRLRAEHGPADVIVANNVMAHVPALNDFVGGIAELLADDGLVTVENPWVKDLVDNGEFDTIYHEHFYYYSCTSVDALVRRHGMYLNHVEYFPDLHGGTLRWHIGKQEDVSSEARRVLLLEQKAGVDTFEFYADFGHRVEQTKVKLREMLEAVKADGGRVAAYGAAAKGSTMLNYVGLGTETLDFVVDRNTYKHGKYMPGVHVPIRPTEALLEEQPDYVLILAWNFTDEIVRQQAEYVRRGGQFIRPVPVPAVLS